MGDASYVIIHYDKNSPLGPELTSVRDIKKALEEGDSYEKADALKQAVLSTLNGAHMPQLVVPIIRYVMPSKDHSLKKLFLLYLEVLDKSGSEMLLVCNALRNDLNHPNEYVRGIVLRFLCKLKDPELLEPLIPSITDNLEHRYSYVRRNAVLAIYAIYKHFPELIMDAPDIIGEFLENENDPSCRRNAFIFLFNCAQDKAMGYLGSLSDQVHSYGDTLQMIYLELARKICKASPAERSNYIRVIFELLQSASPAVRFESALSLLAISGATPAVRAAGQTLIELLIKEGDHNVKLIVLEKLKLVKKSNEKVLSELVMDILRVLHHNPSVDIAKEALNLALDLVTGSNIEDVIQLLKKEIAKTVSKDAAKSAEHRQLLIRTMHRCSISYGHVAVAAANILLDYIGDSYKPCAIDCIGFIREVMDCYPECRPPLVTRLMESLPRIHSARVFRAAFWLIGEHATSREHIEAAVAALYREVGGSLLGNVEEEVVSVGQKSTTLNPDGSYATQSAITEKEVPAKESLLRTLLLKGDLYLGAVLAGALTKMLLRAAEDAEAAWLHEHTAQAVLLLASVLRLAGKTVHDPDSYQRIVTCIHALTDKGVADMLKPILLESSGRAFHALLCKRQARRVAETRQKEAPPQTAVDALLAVRQLVPKRSAGALTEDQMDLDEMDIGRAIGVTRAEKDTFSSRMRKLRQLTGFSDAIYVEAFVNVHQYDIVLDMLVVNRTSDALDNLMINFATQGDLRLVERPQIALLKPGEARNVSANIKVSSTENGVIFGSIFYSVAGGASTAGSCVVLREIHIDIIDYIKPSECSESDFRRMWASFEWENKVPVQTTAVSARAYLEHIIAATNMRCLTPPEDDCAFLSANLYARSIFGEDALANISVEQHGNDALTGFVRIRSKTQGIALSLGDKILTQPL